MAEAKRKNSSADSHYYALILLRTQLQTLRDTDGFVYPEALIFPCKEIERILEEIDGNA